MLGLRRLESPRWRRPALPSEWGNRSASGRMLRGSGVALEAATNGFRCHEGGRVRPHGGNSRSRHTLRRERETKLGSRVDGRDDKPGHVLDLGRAGIINAGSSPGTDATTWSIRRLSISVSASGCAAKLTARPQLPSGSHAGVSVIVVASAGAGTKPSEQRAPDDAVHLLGRDLTCDIPIAPIKRQRHHGALPYRPGAGAPPVNAARPLHLSPRRERTSGRPTRAYPWLTGSLGDRGLSQRTIAALLEARNHLLRGRS